MATARAIAELCLATSPAALAGLIPCFFLGAARPQTRQRCVLAAAVPLAIAYWIVAGWLGEPYDLGRAGLVLLIGLLGAWFVVGSALGLAAGKRWPVRWRGWLRAGS